MEIQLNGHTYKIEKINAIESFHIGRRLMGLLAPLTKANGNHEEAFVKSIGSLSDEDTNYILFGLLKSVYRKEPKGLGLHPVMVDGSLMYNDIDMKTMLQLAGESYKLNLADFSDALPQVLQNNQS